MMCLFTIFWVLALTLSFIVHIRRTNKFLDAMNKNLKKLYEQESQKAKGESRKGKGKESSDAG